jgi:hypothetical protein
VQQAQQDWLATQGAHSGTTWKGLPVYAQAQGAAVGHPTCQWWRTCSLGLIRDLLLWLLLLLLHLLLLPLLVWRFIGAWGLPA